MRLGPFWSGTIGTTPAQLPAWPVAKSVTLRADSGNTGNLLLGPNTNCAFVLGPGESSPPLYVADASAVWFAGSESGQLWSAIAI